MRPAILLLALGAMLIGAAWNTAALFDAAVAIYQNAEARRVYSVATALAGIAALILALVMISRRAYRQLDRDFPSTWKD